MSPVEGALSDYGTATWYMQDHAVVTLGSFGVGLGFTHTVPGAVEQRVQSVSFLYTADANAANRIPRVEYLDAGGDVFAAVATPFLIVATNVTRFTFAIGIQQFGANSAAQIGCSLPDLKLVPGLAVRVAVAGIQATDQITVASLFVDQWPVRE